MADKETARATDTPARLPRKTAWALVWFVVLGAGVLAWRGELPFVQREAGGSDGVAEAAPSPPGPLPAAQPVEAEIEERAAVPTSDASDGAAHLPHQPIDDPDGASMCRFHRALDLLEKGVDRRTVRVLHYGDSILTTDELSGTVRRILQRRFGDAGHGFVLLGRPWRWYHHLDVDHGDRGKWRPRPLTSDPVSDGIYGLGGVAMETRHRAAAWAGTVAEGPVGARVASFDVSYLEQPRGGTVDLYVDGQLTESLSTRADVKGAAHRVLDVKPGPARLTVKTRGDGPVRLLGAVLENDRPGLVYDSLAINGARASVLARYDEAHWKAEMARREPSLVILMFGANEGHNESLVLAEYRQHLAGVLRMIKEGAPRASCLVVGPLDQARRKDDGRLGSRRMPSKLSDAQREVSLAEGCAFFDTFAAMGGKNSMARWFKTGLGGGDLVHPTEHGARRIGSWLADALLAGYDNFLYGGKRCESSATSSSSAQE